MDLQGCPIFFWHVLVISSDNFFPGKCELICWQFGHQLQDMGGNALETSQQYDTFGFTAAEHARKQASKEQNLRLDA